MKIIAKTLSLKKCPPIDNLQKKTKIPNNKLKKMNAGFLKIIEPTKSENAADVSPLIEAADANFCTIADLKPAGQIARGFDGDGIPMYHA